jgi:hypothetical protein
VTVRGSPRLSWETAAFFTLDGQTRLNGMFIVTKKIRTDWKCEICHSLKIASMAVVSIKNNLAKTLNIYGSTGDKVGEHPRCMAQSHGEIRIYLK